MHSPTCTPSTDLRLLSADQRGVTALEYGLIAATVVALGLAGFGTISGDLAVQFVRVANAIDPAAAPPSPPPSPNRDPDD